jgi:hypothetical protein
MITGKEKNENIADQLLVLKTSHILLAKISVSRVEKSPPPPRKSSKSL